MTDVYQLIVAGVAVAAYIAGLILLERERRGDGLSGEARDGDAVSEWFCAGDGDAVPASTTGEFPVSHAERSGASRIDPGRSWPGVQFVDPDTRIGMLGSDVPTYGGDRSAGGLVKITRSDGGPKDRVGIGMR